MEDAAMPTPLEQALPDYHFRERHSRWIDARPLQVWRALTSLTLDDLPIMRLLVAIRFPGSSRAFPQSRSGSLFSAGPLRMLGVTEPTYVVAGGVARPWQPWPARHEVASLQELLDFGDPGWVKYLTDFHLEPRGGGVQLSTETRVYATDRRARRRFALYWLLIRPGSGLIRRDMLAAVARLATRGTPTGGRRPGRSDAERATARRSR
jgi:hypothetical protein